jgi:hypothetical protein
MAKVRFSQRCAGGCGAWLVVGTQAFKLHRGWWCSDCAIKHRSRCSAHDPVSV